MKFKDGSKCMLKQPQPNWDHNDFQNEIKYLSKNFIIKHDNFVKFYGTMQYPALTGLMVMEYADCGTVYDFLYDIKNNGPYVSYSCMFGWMLQCAKV